MLTQWNGDVHTVEHSTIEYYVISYYYDLTLEYDQDPNAFSYHIPYNYISRRFIQHIKLWRCKPYSYNYRIDKTRGDKIVLHEAVCSPCIRDKNRRAADRE